MTIGSAANKMIAVRKKRPDRVGRISVRRESKKWKYRKWKKKTGRQKAG